MRVALYVLGFLVACGVVLGGWVLWYEPQSLAIQRYDIALEDWPHEHDGLTVALLSDLHVGSPYYGLTTLRRVVEATNAAKPDLVLLAGDYVIQGVAGGEFVPPEEIASVLAGLEARLGVFGVLGNHDWWLDGPRVTDAFESVGIRMVDNAAARAGSLWVLGIGDIWEGSPDVDGALEDVTDEGAVLALTHNPDVFPDVPLRVALTLAGHTHGGQVRFPFFGAPVVPSRFGARYAHGHVSEEGRDLFVTTGLGTSIFPVRFRVPPEIALLRLIRADAPRRQSHQIPTPRRLDESR